MKRFGLIILTIFAQSFLLTLPVEATHKEINGCGDDSGLGRFVPNQPVGVDFRPVCDNHDECYGTLSESREQCDNRFRSALRAKCEKTLLRSAGGIFGTVVTGGQALTSCYGVAEVYYRSVRERGGTAYSKAQIHAREELVSARVAVKPIAAAVSGKSLLLHNRDSSQLAIWIMNGTTVAQGGEPQTLGQGWVPISSGDFNRDGKADVLLYNRDSSQLAIWIMNGTTVAQGGEPQTLGQGWVPISSGDFNRDGKADILLYNRDSSQLAIWIMNGTTVAQGGEPQTLGQGWVPINSGDFNRDGKADVLLYNRDNSQLAIWIMNGTTVAQGGKPQTLGQGWVPISSSDFNRDGKADVLLYNRDSSQLAIWIMNGTTVAQGGEPQTLGQGWIPVDNP
jgi:FG-GAP-like repeat